MPDADHIHCDDLIDDVSQPVALRAYLRWARAPAGERYEMTKATGMPKLFATMKVDHVGHKFLGNHPHEGPVTEDVPFKVGQRVRVVMASRFGDVGITPNLEAEFGYVARVHALEALADFSEVP